MNKLNSRDWLNRIDNIPRHEAEALICNVLGCPRHTLYIDPQDLSFSVRNRLDGLLTRRINGEPLQYITEKVYFFDMEFMVKRGVFIPRPETETLVESILETFENKVQEGCWALDLCTGTGCIPISLVRFFSGFRFIGVDISQEAVDCARRNSAKYLLEDRISFLRADLFGSIKPQDEGFKFISANPPYISDEDESCLPRELSWEPRQGLKGGKDGLDYYRRIISSARDFLAEDGYLFLEIGYNQLESVIRLAKDFGFSRIDAFRDLNNIWRVLRIGYG